MVNDEFIILRSSFIIAVETSLHRSLKSLYAGPGARFEVPVDGFRIDVVCGRRLVEIQHGGLAAIRDKVRTLLKRHEVTVVKPIVAAKLLVKLDAPGGRVIERRRSPKRGTILDLFHELVHFTQVFPHRRLALDVPLVEVEERRYPGHGRRRRWRADDYQVEDQVLVAVARVHHFRTAADVAALVPSSLGQPFGTAELATALEAPRWVAQRIAYCLRRIGAAKEVGRRRNARLYAWTGPAEAARRAA